MNRNNHIFISILKSFIQGTTFHDETLTTDDWLSIMNLANIHSDLGIVAYMIKMYPSSATAPLEMKARNFLMHTVSEYANRAELMKVLITRMNNAGIDHLLFKGYVIRNLYPEPELRSFGDIDFLIHPTDREKMHNLMLENGYQVHTDWEPVFSYFKGMEFYEIHTHVMEVDVSDKADYIGYFNKIWEHAHCVNGHSWELDPEFHLIYLLTHIAKHINSSGAGIRMYMDIAFYLQKYRNDINWKHFSREIHSLSFDNFVNMVFTAVERWFDIPSPIKLYTLDDSILEDFLNFTMSGGTFGHASISSGESWLKRENRNDTENVSKLRTILHRIFPPASDIESRYTYLQGHHWLLPAAWIHRWIKTRSSLGDHAEQAMEIMNADTEEIRRMKRMYKEIGL